MRVSILILTLGFVAACAGDKTPAQGQLAEPPYHGARTDIEPANWGNVMFNDVQFSSDGKFLVTFTFRNLENPFVRGEWSGGKQKWLVQVWDAENGNLLRTFEAAGVGLLDAPRRRVITQPLEPNVGGVGVFSIDNGKMLTRFPSRLGRPFTLTDDGSALVFIRPDSIQVWTIEPQVLIRSGANPLPPDQPQPTWASSPDGRWLALGFLPRLPPGSRHRYFLIDLRTVTSFELAVPDTTEERTASFFAFSSDGKRLAIGTGRGIWTYETTLGTWAPFVAGDSRRKLFLKPVGFSDGAARLVAQGDQRVFVFDVASGRTLGSTPVGAGARISVAGPQILFYDGSKEVLHVLDGQDAHPVGWVCAYSCNAPVNHPGWLRYETSPDGRKLVVSHPDGGNGVWSVDENRLLFPLNDPSVPLRSSLEPAGGVDAIALGRPPANATTPGPTASSGTVPSFGERLRSAVSGFTAPPDTVDNFPDAAVNRRFRMRREGIANMEKALRALVAAESLYNQEHGSWTRELPAKYLDWDSLNRAGIHIREIEVTDPDPDFDPGGWWATLRHDHVDFVCAVFVGESDMVFPGAREREPFCKPWAVPGVINQPPPFRRVRTLRMNRPPQGTWEWRDRCQGGRCEFHSLVACTDIKTYVENRLDSPPSFSWKKGEEVFASESVVQLINPGIVIFRESMTVPVLGADHRVRITPADTAYVMSDAGDGTWDWYFHRTQRRTPPFWSADGPARLIRSEQTVWWLWIIRANGQGGWVFPAQSSIAGLHPSAGDGPERCKS